MDDSRIPPFHGSSESDDFSTKDGESDFSIAQDLSHRPRDHAKLPRSGLRLASSKGAAVPGHEQSAASGQSIATPTDETPDLRSFADQLTAIAEQLRSGIFSSVVVDHPGQAQGAPHDIKPLPKCDDTAPEWEALDPEARRRAFADLARATYARRRKRTAIFGDPELFGEPGWDILLDLYIAQAEDKPVSVSSACIGSASPPTTGLRWLGVLAEQGLVAREHDPQDQRRVLVRLTDKALNAMDDYFLCSASMYTERRTARA